MGPNEAKEQNTFIIIQVSIQKLAKAIQEKAISPVSYPSL